MLNLRFFLRFLWIRPLDYKKPCTINHQKFLRWNKWRKKPRWNLVTQVWLNKGWLFLSQLWMTLNRQSRSQRLCMNFILLSSILYHAVVRVGGGSKVSGEWQNWNVSVQKLLKSLTQNLTKITNKVGDITHQLNSNACAEMVVFPLLVPYLLSTSLSATLISYKTLKL